MTVLGAGTIFQAERVDDGRLLRTSPSDEILFINMKPVFIWNDSAVSKYTHNVRQSGGN